MKIRSDFKDYYDGIMAWGQDADTVWQRRRRVETVNWFPFPSMDRRCLSMGFNQHVVGFCGKIYPVLELNLLPWAGHDYKDERASWTFAFTLDDVRKFIQKNFDRELFEDFQDPNRFGGRRRKKHWDWEFREKAFELYFERFEKERDKHALLFEAARSPVFVAEYTCEGPSRSGGTVTWNAPLKPLEFYRVFDAARAYQEISMWFNNQAEPRKPIPPISDEDMVEIKGFDKRYSFRKDKAKK